MNRVVDEDLDNSLRSREYFGSDARCPPADSKEGDGVYFRESHEMDESRPVCVQEEEPRKPRNRIVEELPQGAYTRTESANTACSSTVSTVVEPPNTRLKTVQRRRYLERLRNINFNDSQRPSEADLRRLDSSLKKCTGFVRKIRTTSISEELIEGLMHEGGALNLSRYLSEVVAAIAETKVRGSDTAHVARFCGELHRRYAEFADLLTEALTNVASSSSREVITRRSAMRLLVELLGVNIVQQPTTLVSLIKDMMKNGRDHGEDALANMSVVAACAKAAGPLFFSMTAMDDRTSDVDAQESNSSMAAKLGSSAVGDFATWETEALSLSFKSQIFTVFQLYYRELSGILASLKEELQAMDAAVHASRLNRGIEDETVAVPAASARKLYDRVYGACVSIAEALNRHPPEQYVFTSGIHGSTSSGDPLAGRGRVAVGLTVGGSRISKNSESISDIVYEDGQEYESPFETEAERLFYTELPKLPPDNLEREKIFEKGSSGRKKSERFADATSASKSVDLKALSSREDLSSDRLSMISTNESDTVLSTKESSPTSSKTGPRSAIGSSRSAPKNLSSGKRSKQSMDPNAPTLDALMAQLTSIDSAKLADRFVVEFCTVALSNRASSKRLTKQLVNVPPHLLNVLPAYGRIAASLQNRFPEIVATVVSHLDEDLRLHISRTDHDEKSIASSVRTARYIGEHVKFLQLSSATFFDLIALCIKDFTGHKVEIACHMLESCGGYLFRSPSSNVRISNILDTVWRLKSVRNLEPRLNAMVETAYFSSRPRGSRHIVRRKRLDPVREYVRAQICSSLEESNAEKIAFRFRKLPWDPELEMFITKVFLNVSYFRFSRLRAVAKLLAALSKDRSSVGVAVCDGLLEHICLGMERNDGRDSQRRIAQVVLLGEIFNCRLLNTPVIFQILYQFITLGHEDIGFAGPNSLSAVKGDDFTVGMNAATPMKGINMRLNSGSAPDPPGDFFRVRLVCTMLDVCVYRLAVPSGSRKRSTRRQLEVFWAYFDRYVLLKALQAGPDFPLPLHVEHLLADTLESTRRALEHARDVSKKLSSAFNSKMKISGGGSARDDSRNVAESSESSPAPAIPLISRSQTMEETMLNIARIESVPSNLSLISLPQRKFVKKADRSSMQSQRHSQVGSLRDLNEITSVANSDGDTILVSDDSNDSDEITCGSTVENDCSDAEEINEEICNAGDVLDDMGRLDEDAEENGDVDDDATQDGDDEAGDEEEEEEEEDDDYEEDEYVVAPPCKVKTEEEDEFEKELAAYTASEVQSAKKGFTGHAALDRMAIPIGLMAKRQESDRASAIAAAVATESVDVAGSKASRREYKKDGHSTGMSLKRDSTVSFTMLVRRGGKSQIRDLEVPSASSLAVAAKQSESQGAAAHEEMKRLVLESNAVLNSEEDDGVIENDIFQDPVHASRERERIISEQRAADERALLLSLFRGRKR